MNFVFDIDGTICFRNNKIDFDIIESINYLESKGHNVIFASARSYRDCLPVIEKFKNNIIIGLNGGLCYKNSNLHFSKSIDYSVYKNIIKILEKYDLPFFVDDYINYSCYKEKEIPFFNNVDLLNVAKRIEKFDVSKPIKIVVSLIDNNIVNEIIEKINNCGKLNLLYNDVEKLLYINPFNVNKGSTLKSIISGEYICFGNDTNDIEMFENSIYAVQVGKNEELKKYADINITELSVAETIKKLADKYSN